MPKTNQKIIDKKIKEALKKEMKEEELKYRNNLVYLQKKRENDDKK